MLSQNGIAVENESCFEEESGVSDSEFQELVCKYDFLNICFLNLARAYNTTSSL